ncbi:hypothetical protein BT93_L4207 [Corymbia citriodora subsp. variegata]|uniref:non-specific serine/threonine protein kinase n=1 Tax=Corymbia citriodora subsp. variegata TaxID=360336 RepID=A0A8T0CY54_CORYI|nr:hypothetical protein BT93_L4207 [Corymbia citriodora subsp. variegata]
MAKITFFIFIIVPMIGLSLAADILVTNSSIRHGETLVSSNLTFELGFFTPGNSSMSYLGIWFMFSPKTVVWVANRNNPLADHDGVLTFSSAGNLVVLNQSNGVVWSSKLSRVLHNPIAQLLDSGNLVLKDDSVLSSDEAYLWQSFDYPSDTLLAGMKLALNLKTGFERRLTAWKSMDDPSPGDYVHELNYSQCPPQYEVVQVHDHSKKYRTGQWNGVQFVGGPNFPSPAQVPLLLYNETEISFMFEVRDRELFSMLKLNSLGVMQFFVVDRSRSATWNVKLEFPSDPCDVYGRCGANAICSGSLCECVKGFMPKWPREWAIYEFSSGCKRTIPTNCSKGEGFWEIKKVKLPDVSEVTLNRSMSLKECKDECLKNCSCAACANSDIRGGGSGCVMWFGDLIDMRVLAEGNHVQTLYIRLSASELDQEKSLLLTWQRRFDIVVGIARGLLYLHHDSKLQVIHRDLKASNILLDSDLNPKISDFGLARIFGANEKEAMTKRVIGTYGYMAPEYAMDGKFSLKSDIYSFGVLLLEIVSGKKNRGFSHQSHHHNLLGHVSK